MEFQGFPKIARLSRDCVITEKLDGTSAQLLIGEDGEFLVGSRTRWITPEDDNYGFARWAQEHKDELMQLGAGRHFGEWWGNGIQRSYNLKEKKFSLFNTGRWNVDNIPACCSVVPMLYTGIFTTEACNEALEYLETNGSLASPGFMNPEGIVIFHVHAGISFKKTIKNDEVPKGKVKIDKK